MKHLIHLSLFESQNSEPVCDYYDDKKPDSGHFDFWSDFKKLNPEQKKAKFEEIKRKLSELSTQNKKEYVEVHKIRKNLENILYNITLDESTFEEYITILIQYDQTFESLKDDTNK